MGHAEYLEHSYYEHWLVAFEEVLNKRGFVTHAEREKRIAELEKGAH